MAPELSTLIVSLLLSALLHIFYLSTYIFVPSAGLLVLLSFMECDLGGQSVSVFPILCEPYSSRTESANQKNHLDH